MTPSPARLEERLWQRLGVAEQKRLAHLRRELSASPDPATGGRLLAEMGSLIARASNYDGLEDSPDQLPVDYVGYAQTWADVLRLQEEGIDPGIFQRIQVPVLMLHGAVDPHPGPETRDLLRRHLTNLEYHELAQCGHQPWNEKNAKAAFFKLVRGWIARYAGVPGS
jgi:pimeloyl-ACP methyl ester carboxylesterase